ncbi:MAG TPA: polysulfide reductase NrfD [Anaerolineae bacterium]|nr:polysulfide reductase NrfD [Anaerolineae bacterium]
MATNLHVEQSSSSAVPLLNRRMALALLGLMVLVGGLAGIIRLFAGLGRTTALVDAYPWGIWIGFDFTLIAFAGAGFTMAGLAHVLHQHKYHDAVRPAILAGLAGYVAVLLLLVLDLGRPDRFYHFIFFWNFHSPLFEISWCVLLYTTVLLLEVSPFLLERINRPLSEKLLRVATMIMPVVAVVGVTLSSLHQSTLGTLYLNMPHRLHALWYSPALPVLFFVSSIMAGLSLATLAYGGASYVLRRPAKRAIIDGLARLTGWVALLYLVLKLGDLLVSGELALIWSAGAYSAWWWLEMSLGLILPLALLFIPALRRPWTPVIAPLLLLFGVMMNRFNATMFGQLLPANVNYSPHILEWLSTLGIIGAAVMAWLLGVRFLAIFEEKKAAQK